MIKKAFTEKFQEASEEGRRLVVPLMGFPGLTLTGSMISLAQQNYGEHYKVLRALADEFHPDLLFPLMDLSVEANAVGRYTLFPQEDSATVVKEYFDISSLTWGKRVNIAFDTRLLGYVETVKLMNIGLPQDILKGAYVSGPYTLAALMMGADDAALATVLEPEKLNALCEFATEKIQEYMRLLIAAGTQVFCLLEPSAVMLGPSQFEQFSSSWVKHITNSFKYTGVSTVYHTCGNTMHLLDKMVESGVDAVSLDSVDAGVDLPLAAQMVGEDVVVIGNISPTGTILNSSPQAVEEEVNALLKDMEPYPNFVLSTGCDLPQETPLENIHAFMNAGRRYRMK